MVVWSSHHALCKNIQAPWRKQTKDPFGSLTWSSTYLHLMESRSANRTVCFTQDLQNYLRSSDESAVPAQTEHHCENILQWSVEVWPWLSPLYSAINTKRMKRCYNRTAGDSFDVGRAMTPTVIGSIAGWAQKKGSGQVQSELCW